MIATAPLPFSRPRPPGLLVRIARRARLLLPVVVLAGLFSACDPVAPPGVPVMGTPRLSVDQIVRFYKAKAPASLPYRASVPIEELVTYFWWEGLAEGVRGDMAVIQSIIESAWFNFPDYGLVRPGDNNFAGIGACDTCSSGLRFATAQLGVRAQIQHLRNYADGSSRASNLANPPVSPLYSSASKYDSFWRKGKAPVWNLMGGYQPDGYVNWATDPKYGEKVIKLYNDMLSFNGLAGECPPDGLSFGSGGPKANCPASLQQPGRAIEANPNGGYYTLNGDGTVKAFGGAPFFGAPLFSSDLARDLAVMPDGQGYVVLDAWGGLHRFGSAAARLGWLSGSYWPGQDMARAVAITPTGNGFTVLDAWGGLHPRGDAPVVYNGFYNPGFDSARAVHISLDNRTVYTLDAFGGLWNNGPGPFVPSPYFGWDVARDFELIEQPGVVWGAYVVDAFGAVFAQSPFLRQVQNPGWAQADRWRSVTYDVPAGKVRVMKNDGSTVAL